MASTVVTAATTARPALVDAAVRARPRSTFIAGDLHWF